jgi:hypothetical protein
MVNGKWQMANGKRTPHRELSPAKRLEKTADVASGWRGSNSVRLRQDFWH